MPPTLRLPRADGTLASYTLSGRAAITPPTGPITSRIGMAAVHVVADPVAAIHPTLDVEAAYEEQCSFIEGAGGRIILMASRALAACARGPEDYEKVYARILAQVSEPVIIHWLGDMFDPALAGYWGSLDLDRATETLL